MHRLLLKLRRRRSLERDLETELAFHRDMAALQGNPASLGNTTVLSERARDLWRFNFAENLWRDLVYGARSLRRSPALIFTAVLSLGLGIGLNTGIFSLAVEFLFSQPSVTGASSIVAVRLGGNSHVKKDVVDFVRASGFFQDVVGENEEVYMNWDDGAETRQLFSAQLTKNYFTALGVPMAYGRGIVPNDSDQVVVLANRFWRTHLRGDPDAINHTLRLDGRPYTVVGILPADFRSLIGFGYSPDVYVPRYLDDTILAIYARLKPGMTIGQARAGVVAVARRVDQALPEEFKYGESCQVTAVAGMDRIRYEQEMQTVGLFFVVLLLVVGLVLLIACVNVASLLLARGSARRQELAIRLSLGAGRSRLFQQLLTESALLSLLGAGAGLLLREALAVFVERLQLPLPLPIHLHMSLDWRVTLYAILLASFSTIACGMLPAWRSIRHSIAPDLHRETRLRMQRALVVAQLTLSMVVLAAGLLFLRNLLRTNSISPGFDVRHTVFADMNLPPEAYHDTASKQRYVTTALRELAALPGIQSAAAARVIPFTNGTRFMTGLHFPDTKKKVQAFFYWNAVSPDYFLAMGIPLQRGRSFDPSADASAHEVIVNRAFAARYLADADPLGRRFLWGESRQPYTVVGIVDGTKNFSIGEEEEPQLYEDLAHIRNDRTRIEFVLRSATPPGTQLQAVHAALRRVEPGAGLIVGTLYSAIGLAFLPSQAGAALLGGLGALGLILAAIGLYGVMVYSVSRRTREIGVRLAFGADRRAITKMMLSSAVKLIAIGSAAGLLCAFFLVKPLAMFLVPGLRPSDPLTFIAVAALLAATGFAATWGPARRAATIDPIASLRHE